MAARSGRSSSNPEFEVSNPGSFLTTVVSVVTSPPRFFASIPQRGNVVNPLVFALVTSFVAILLTTILSLVGVLSTTEGTTGGGIAGFIGTLILTPILAVIIVFVLALILHGIVSFLVRPNAGFEANLRIVAYSWVTALVAWIPVVGWILALYTLYIAFAGVRAMHNTTPRNALIAVAATTIIAIVINLILGGTIIGTFAGTSSGV